MDAPVFTLRHVGFNAENEAEAKKLVTLLSSLFHLEPERETDSHIFAGSLFEVMKGNGRGEKGHIALGVEDMPAAIRYFEEKGIGVLYESAVRNSAGEITLIYLDLDILGFAFHLVN